MQWAEAEDKGEKKREGSVKNVVWVDFLKT